MRRMNLAMLACGSVTLCGCASTLQTDMIAPGSPARTEVPGIPYYMPERLVAEVYQKTDKGYVKVGEQLQTLPDPTKIYVMNFSGQMLADASLKIEQRADGTLSTVHLTGASRIAETATSVASGLDALQASKKTIADADKAAQAQADASDASTRTKAAAATQAIYDALTTRDAVTQLELTLSDTRAGLKPSEIFALESQIRLARLKANAAAVAVGQEIPYPSDAPD